MNGAGGTEKQRVFCDVKSGKDSITNAEHFAAHPHKWYQIALHVN